MSFDRLDRVTKREVRDLLGKGWLTHDGMWFLAAADQLGVEAANELNRRAIRGMSEFEVRRLLDTLGVSAEDLVDAGAIATLLEDALALLLPGSVAEHFEVVPGGDRIHWEWEPGACFAYKGMQRAGLLEAYECGVIYRIRCWFEHLGIPADTDPVVGKCLMADDGRCSGDFLIGQGFSR
jgi:hypothetical protein